MTNSCLRQDLSRIVFSITFIVIMTIGCFLIIRPFIIGFSWASMVVIATWPLLIRFQQILWGRRSLAAITMTMLLLLLFVFPISMLVSSIMDNSAPLVAWAIKQDKWSLPAMVWLQDVPIIGSKLYYIWNILVSDRGEPLILRLQPYLGIGVSWLLNQAASLGNLLIHCILMIIFSIILYMRGEIVAMIVRDFAARLGNQQGESSVLLAAQAIRAVALGVVLTAIMQTVLGGIGIAITGIPIATVLTAVMFVLCIAQLGPLPVLIPAILWLYWNEHVMEGTMLLAWSCIVATLDNILRPIFIHIGADLPMPLVLFGVLGGLLAFGMIGLFIGPVILDVSWRLILAWIQEEPSSKTNII